MKIQLIDVNYKDKKMGEILKVGKDISKAGAEYFIGSGNAKIVEEKKENPDKKK